MSSAWPDIATAQTDAPVPPAIGSSDAEQSPLPAVPIPVESGTDASATQDKQTAAREAIHETAQQRREKRLDTLFDQLKRTSDPVAATSIVAEINGLWRKSGSATIDLLVDWANKARLERRYASAMDFLSEAIALDPDFAEAWHIRATVAYQLHDYDRAMADISHALELEPRHFSALYGMAGILHDRGLKQQSIRALERVLAIYPMFRDAQIKLNALTDELSDIRA